MRLELQRVGFEKFRTIGRMMIDGQFFCFTLEPVFKKAGKPRAIPTGTYTVELYPSERFKAERPLLMSVPDFEGIMIHEGNTEQDTHGCILVGYPYTDKLLNSRKTLTTLISRLKAEKKQTVQIVVSGRPKNPADEPKPSGGYESKQLEETNA